MSKKYTSCKRPDFLRMIYRKYMLGEIGFDELRHRMLAANKTFEWVNSVRVDSRAYNRLNFRLTQDDILNERFLNYLAQGQFTDDFIVTSSDLDFPRDLKVEELKTPARNEPLFRTSRSEPSIIS